MKDPLCTPKIQSPPLPRGSTLTIRFNFSLKRPFWPQMTVCNFQDLINLVEPILYPKRPSESPEISFQIRISFQPYVAYCAYSPRAYCLSTELYFSGEKYYFSVHTVFLLCQNFYKLSSYMIQCKIIKILTLLCYSTHLLTIFQVSA